MTVRKIGDTAVTSPMRRALLLVLATMFFLSVTAFAVPPVIYDVTVTDGDTVTTVQTIKKSPESILGDVGIILSESRDDRIAFCEFFPESETAQIVVRRGAKVTVKNPDGSRKTVYSSRTVGDALLKAGVELSDGRVPSVSEDTQIFDSLTVEIYDVYEVSVSADGKVYKESVSGGCVEDAVAALGIELSDEDYTTPERNEKLSDGMEITVHRVELKERVEEEAIPYETEYTYSDEMYKNRSKVVRDGKNGTKELVYTEKYVDGVLSDTALTDERVKKDAVSRIVKVGTKANPLPKTLPTSAPMSELTVPSYVNIGANGVPTNYSSVINAKATAYCIPGGTTSTGKRAQAGYIAVDPNEIPYGTEMYIVSADGKYVYGYCIAADTGGFIYDVDWTVDLYMNTLDQCWQWGRRDILIYIL